MTDSFVFYRSFYESMAELSDAERLELMDAICEYVLNDNEITLSNVSTRALFRVIKEKLKSNVEKQKNGSRGGRPPNKKPVVSEQKTSGFQNKKPVVSEQKTSGFKNKNRRLQKSESTVTVTDTVADTVADTDITADKPPVCSSSGRKKFVPPTLEEAAAYCNERRNNVDPSTFIDFYTANGWTQGHGKPIKDWKACVRTWEQRRKHEQQPKTRSPKEDYDEIFGGLM